MRRVCVIGEGAWGTAIATLLARNGHNVHLWCFESEVATAIALNRKNERYLPIVSIHENITPTSSEQEAMDEVEWVFESTPVKFLRSVLERFKSLYHSGQRWVILSKGIEQKSLLFPSQLLNDVFGTTVSSAVLAGPSFAKDLVQEQPTGVVIASASQDDARGAKALVENDFFRVDISGDLLGVQCCAAFKNVIALGVGILDGAGYQDNTKSLFLVRMLDEMKQLLYAIHADTATVMTLAGVGDVVLTALGAHSRNMMVGRRIGQGESLESILKQMGCIPEGVNTVESLRQLAHRENMVLPLTQAVDSVLVQAAHVGSIVALL